MSGMPLIMVNPMLGKVLADECRGCGRIDDTEDCEDICSKFEMIEAYECWRPKGTMFVIEHVEENPNG